MNSPRGPRPSGAPLLIGSNGERLLKAVAQYADAWNSDWVDDPARMATLIANVDAACEAAGRSPESLIKTGSARFAMRDDVPQQPGMVVGSRDVMVDRLVEFRNLGLHHFVCGIEPRTVPIIEEFGEVIARYDARS